jgi:acetyltransferase-like isoleucine patch superfamily enzyme
MKKTVIVGTGAVAAELTSYIIQHNESVEDNMKIDLVGYLEYDYNIEKYWKKYKFTKPVLGDIDTFTFDQGFQFLIGISDIKFRNAIIFKIERKGGVFGQFIHHSVIIPEGAKIGIGNIIYPYCIIGPNTEIGNFNMITSYSFISHDCVIGNGNFFSTTGVAGRVVIGDNNFFGIRSTIIPDISVGNQNIIQAGMIVDKRIENDSVIFHRFKEKVFAIKEN